MEKAPAIAAEVLSSGTAVRDRTSKFELYKDEGVQYFLILDPEPKQLTAFSLDSNGVYQQMVLADELNLNICNGCELQIVVSKIFA